jgi:multidrug efflux pump subunit AcrA (membrane-fusion protein)
MYEAGIWSRLVRRWWLGLLAILVVGAVSVGVVVVRGGSDSAPLESAVPASRDLLVVQRQSFITEVPLEGRLLFPNTAELTFDVTGEVGELAVAPGQRVQPGQVLARLDSTRRVSLEAAVAQARLDLDQAQDVWETASERFATTPVDKARFEQKIADVRLALENAEDGLDDFLRDQS